MAVQLRPHPFEHLIGIGHRVRPHDAVQGQQQMHHRIVDETEQHLTCRLIRAQPAHDGHQTGLVHGLDRVLQFLGHLAGGRIQIIQRGDGVIDALSEVFERRLDGVHLRHSSSARSTGDSSSAAVRFNADDREISSSTPRTVRIES